MPLKQRIHLIEGESYDIAPMKSDVSTLPVISDLISVNGEIFPSPIKLFITQKYNHTTFDRAKALDEKLRYSPNNSEPLYAQYQDIEIYLESQIALLGYVILNYDYLSQRIQLPYEKDYYAIFLPNIIRLMMDYHYTYITNLQRKSSQLSGTKMTLKSKTEDIYDIIENKLKKIDELVVLCEAHIKHYQVICDEIIPHAWIFRFYHTYGECLLFKARISPTLNKSTLKNIGLAGVITKLDETFHKAYTKNDISLAFDYYFILARIEFNIYFNTKKAEEYAEKAIKAIPVDCQPQPDIIKHAYMPSTIFRLDIATTWIGNDFKRANIDYLSNLFSIAQEANGYFQHAYVNHRREFSKLITVLFKIAIERIHYEHEFGDIEAQTKLLAFINKAIDALPLFEQVPVDSEKSAYTASMIIHREALRALQVKIESKIKSLEKEEADLLANISSLQEREAVYNQQFPHILKQFQTTVKKATIRKREPDDYTPTRVPIVITPDMQDFIKTAIEKSPSFSEFAANYFNDNPSVAFENLLDLPEAQEHLSEANVYVGDKYENLRFYSEALDYYETAYELAINTETPNESLIEGIKFRLLSVSDLLQMAIQQSELDIQAIKTSRRNLFIKLGIRELKFANAPKEAFDLRLPENLKNILKLGENAFITIGRKNREMGKPLSAQAVFKSQMEAYLNFLYELQAQSKEINERAQISSSEPSSNPASLFAHKPKDVHTPKTEAGMHTVKQPQSH